MKPAVRQLLIGGIGLGPHVINAQLLRTKPFLDLLGAGRRGTKTYVLLIGDSIPFGFGSNATSNQMRLNGWGPKLATFLSGLGVKAQAQGFFGNGNIHGASTESRLYDARLSAGGSVGVNTVGGQSFLFSSAASNTLTFTPTGSVDTFEVYQYRFGGAGVVSYSIDGGAAVNMDFNNTAGLNVLTVSAGSLGAHSIAFAYVSGAGGYILGMNAYDSTRQGLQFINGCNCGGVASDYTPNTNQYDPLKVGVALAPGAVFIGLGANHWNTAASVSTFAADLQTLITAYSAVCPVVLISDPASDPTDVGNATIANQIPYVEAMKELARVNRCLMFDLWGAMGTEFATNWQADGIHPSPAGHTAIVNDHLSKIAR